MIQGLSAPSWYVGVGSVGILRLPPTVEKRAVSGVGLVGDSKLLIGVNVSVMVVSLSLFARQQTVVVPTVI